MKEVEAANEGAAVRLENLEFPYEGKAYLKVTTHSYRGEKLESPYALELTRLGDDAPAAASDKPAAASDKAAPARAAETAPGQPSTTTAGGSQATLIGLGVVGVGVLIAGAYLLGRRR